MFSDEAYNRLFDTGLAQGREQQLLLEREVVGQLDLETIKDAQRQAVNIRLPGILAKRPLSEDAKRERVMVLVRKRYQTAVAEHALEVSRTGCAVPGCYDDPNQMNWNDAAEDLLNQILSRTPRPDRERTEESLRETAELIADEDGRARVGVETVVAAWVRNTPETIRPDLPRQMESLGLDPDEYSSLL